MTNAFLASGGIQFFTYSRIAIKWLIFHPWATLGIFTVWSLLFLGIFLLLRARWKKKYVKYMDNFARYGREMYNEDKKLLIWTLVLYWVPALALFGYLTYGYFKTIDGGELVNPFELEELIEWIDLVLFCIIVYFILTIIHERITQINLPYLLWETMTIATDASRRNITEAAKEDKKYVVVTTYSDGSKKTTPYNGSLASYVLHLILQIIKLAIYLAMIFLQTLANFLLCLVIFPILLPIFMHNDKKLAQGI